jgi:hypothetical protein
MAVDELAERATNVEPAAPPVQVSVPLTDFGQAIRSEIPRKISDKQVAEIRRRFAAGERAPVLALEFGIARSSVSNIAAGRARVRAGGPITRPSKRRPQVTGEKPAPPAIPSASETPTHPWQGGKVLVTVGDRDIKASVKEIRKDGSFVLVLPGPAGEVVFSSHGVGDDAACSWVPDEDLVRILGHVGLTLASGMPM